jgi:hypothetical protein
MVNSKLREEIHKRVAQGNRNMRKQIVQSVDLVNVRIQLAAEKTLTVGTARECRKRKRSQEKCCCADDSVMEMVVGLNSGSTDMDPGRCLKQLWNQEWKCYAGDICVHLQRMLLDC